MMPAPLESILFCPIVELEKLPAAELDVLRRFFLYYLRGMDRKHARRLLRLVRRVVRAPAGEGFQIFVAEERGGPFHRMHRVILSRLFEHQDRFTDEDVMHDWMKLKCWHVDWKDGKPTPASTEFRTCSENRMREFHSKMVDLLRQPWAMHYFWPAMRPVDRHEMVDFILKDPTTEEPTP